MESGQRALAFPWFEMCLRACPSSLAAVILSNPHTSSEKFSALPLHSDMIHYVILMCPTSIYVQYILLIYKCTQKSRVREQGLLLPEAARVFKHKGSFT